MNLKRSSSAKHRRNIEISAIDSSSFFLFSDLNVVSFDLDIYSASRRPSFPFLQGAGWKSQISIFRINFKTIRRVRGATQLLETWLLTNKREEFPTLPSLKTLNNKYSLDLRDNPFRKASLARRVLLSVPKASVSMTRFFRCVPIKIYQRKKLCQVC